MATQDEKEKAKKKHDAIYTLICEHWRNAQHGVTLASALVTTVKVLQDLGIPDDDIKSACPSGVREVVEDLLNPPGIKYPATVLVQWVDGPHAACDEHARQLQVLGGALGTNIPITALTEPTECINCRNEADGDKVL